MLRNDWAEQGTPHSPFVSLNASTVVAVTEMGPVGGRGTEKAAGFAPSHSARLVCRNAPPAHPVQPGLSCLCAASRGRAQSHGRRGGCPGGAGGASLGP